MITEGSSEEVALGSTDGVSGIGLDSDRRAGSGSQVDGAAFVSKPTGEVGAGLSWVATGEVREPTGPDPEGAPYPEF